MRAFQFKAATSPKDATSSGPDTAFIAGGTNLIDLMKSDVVTPTRLVDLGPAEALKGKTANRKAFAAATEQAAEGARTLSQNGFKVSLVKKTIIRALSEVGGMA